MKRGVLRLVPDRHLPTGIMYLERHHPARRMHRYYCLTVERNLFGEWSLVRTWGRIGKPSQRKIELHPTEQDAQAALWRKAQEKRRKGYR